MREHHVDRIKIIGFAGKAGAGKTTASDYMVRQHGFVKVNFKDALVDEMKKSFWNTLVAMGKLYHVTSITWANKFPGEVSDEALVEFLFQDKPEAMRCFMQNYGTELRRSEDEQYWIKRYLEKVNNVLSNGGRVVTDDTRFLNEEKAIKDLGGVIILMQRENHNPISNHLSELEMEQFTPDYKVMAGQGKHNEIYERLTDILHGKG